MKDEDKKPWDEVRWVIAGTSRGDETFAVHYDREYLGYTWYREWSGRLGYARLRGTIRDGFASRAAAVESAETALMERLARGWRRISRPGLVALQAALKKKRR